MINYSELVDRAREIVEDLDEPYRGLAFQVIFQELVREGRSAPKEKREVTAEEEADAVSLFMQRAVDASAFTSLFSQRGRLVEKSLAVLLLARDEFGIDGMSSPEIAEVLTKKFRVPQVHARNITTGLSRRPEYVSRVRAGRGYKYLLMVVGESHLKQTISELPP